MSPDHALVTVSVVVPVYNSEATLGTLVARLVPALEQATSAFEIVLVNDGSTDDSWRVIRELAAQWPSVRGIDLARNCGQHNALLCGIRLARYAAIVTIDDDLQNRPEDVPALLAPLADGFDVVYGRPTQRQWGFVRNTASHAMKLALRTTMAARTAELVSGFRAFRAPVRDAFADYRAPITNIDVMLTWGASRFTAVPVTHEPRTHGRSGYTYYRLFVHTWNMATGFSTVPLQVATAVGFTFTLMGLATLAYALVRYAMFGGVVQGFTFLASIISIYAGAQLFATGIIGEYLGRMFQRTSGQPGYVVRQESDGR